MMNDDHVHLLEDASQAASLSGGAPAAHGADRALVVPGQHKGEERLIVCVHLKNNGNLLHP